MAPDVNSLPTSPRSDRAQPAQTGRTSSDASRGASQQMPPPPIPVSSSSQHPPPQRSPVLVSNEQAGPMRHPRPLTAAELYLECEKEQEAVVNRLTRELTALRAQTASVASNASQSSNSTSASLLPVDISDPNPAHQLTGATHPTPSQRHRSSSSLSARSQPNTPSTSVSGSGTTNISTQVQTGGSTAGPLGGQSQASADRARAAAAGGGQLSRQPSISASGTSTPARQSLDIARGVPTGTSYPLPHRPSLSRDPSYASQSTAVSSTAAHAGTPLPISPTQSITSQHYSETAAYRTEMEAVKAENESLRQRVRALERALRARRRDSSNSDAARSDFSSRREDPRRDPLAHITSPVLVSPEPRSAVSPGVAAWAADGGVGGVAPPRERSESQSTTASSRRGMGMQAEDEVRLGESAGSVGIGRGV